MELTTTNQNVEIKKKKKDKDAKGTPKNHESKEKKPTTLKIIQDDELTSEMLKRKAAKICSTGYSPAFAACF